LRNVLSQSTAAAGFWAKSHCSRLSCTRCGAKVVY